MSDDLTLTDEQLAELSFEAAQARLESVVAELEGGQLPLDRALALYSLGIRLRDHCRRRLTEAEGLLERLRESATAPEPAEEG